MLNQSVKKTGLIVIFLFGILLTMCAEVPIQTANKEFDAALKLFLDAKDSDNPRLDYRNGLAALDKASKITKDNDAIVRCHYFRAFSYFILRDYDHANQEIEKVIKLASDIYPAGGPIKYEGDIIAAVQDGSASLNEALIALTANEMKSAAAFGKSLEKYFNKTKGEANEELINRTAATIVTLAILSQAFCSAENLAEEKTAQSLCQDNMRQIIKGWLAYIKNNQDRLPPICLKVNNTGSSCHDRAEWSSIIGKYLPDPDLQKAKFDAPAIAVKIMPGSVMQCPGAQPWPSGYTSSYGVDYGMNHAVPEAAKTLGQINNPHDLIVFVDSKNSFAGPAWGYQYVQFRHSGGTNVAYADGHVDWKSKAELPDDNKLAMWKPQQGPVYKVKLDVEDQETNSPINTQTVIGTIRKPTYVSQGEGLIAKIKNVPALKGKALIIGDNSEKLGQNIAFTIDPVKSGKYEIKFDYLPLKSENSHVAVFDLRNSASKQFFVLTMHNNMNDLSIIIDGKEKLLTNTLTLDNPASFSMIINFDNWTYELSVNGKNVADGALSTLDVHNLSDMAFWTPGISEFAIKNLIADIIK
ncbi:MAG: H-X9-DG-CTERM domain-containing protein [Lentisphaerota bacterium]